MFRIQIPATTANLGPGYDCLGLALNLYNEIYVQEHSSLRISIEGEGEDSIPKNGHNMAWKAYRRAMERLGQPPVNLSIRQINRIPSTRGLGSSASAVVGGILAACAVANMDMPLQDILSLAADIEGHPDNVAPAIMGGFCVAIGDRGYSRAFSFAPPSSLVPIALLPSFELPTQKARAVLPRQVPHRDAVFNTGRAAFLTAAFAQGDVDAMLSSIEDRLHQPYRAALIPGFNEIQAFCSDLGAAAFLSGAGPTIMVFCHSGQAGDVLAELPRLLRTQPNRWDIVPLQCQNQGAYWESL